MSVHESSSEAATTTIAQNLAKGAKPGDVFLLEGPLGAGKSVFARGFIRALCGPDTEVPSPTFTLVQTYDGAKGPIWHFDLYRLEDPDEVFELGWEEALTDGIVLIEWPAHAGLNLPARARWIRIGTEHGESRRIVIDDA